MKELTLFVMRGCPYCRQAKQYLEELRQENADYAAIPIREIDENVERELADSYDYYYVPSFYLGRESLLTSGPAKMLHWRKSLFAYMSRNAWNATTFFGIPPGRVVELGTQVEL